MKSCLGILLTAVIVVSFGDRIKSADDKDAQAILDMAIKALGGQDKLSRIKAVTWKTQGKITSNGNDMKYTSTLTVQGLNRFHFTFESEFNGRMLKVVTILSKDKGWRKVGDKKMTINDSTLADQMRAMYLEVIPMMLVPLNDKSFKITVAAERQIEGSLAAGLKVTGPEGKDFTLFFNKDSGLPIMLIAKMGGGSQ